MVFYIIFAIYKILFLSPFCEEEEPPPPPTPPNNAILLVSLLVGVVVKFLLVFKFTYYNLDKLGLLLVMGEFSEIFCFLTKSKFLNNYLGELGN